MSTEPLTKQTTNPMSLAKTLRSEHFAETFARETNKNMSEEAQREAESLRRAGQYVLEVEGVATNGSAELERRAADEDSRAQVRSDWAKAHEERRQDNLVVANEHLQQNRESYEQAAIDDANAAGHDVAFGGQTYPAQIPEQPRELVAQ